MRGTPVETPLAERVQRILDGDLPALQIEPEMPDGDWDLVVDGCIDEPLTMRMQEVRTLPSIERYIDLHCVWGWSRPDLRWEGFHLGALGVRVRPQETATHVLVTARSSPYAACFTVAEVRDGVFAWRLDGADLTKDRGWPLRFVAPSYKWGYKHVKWVERITFLDHFEAGLWESRVGNPRGDVPWDVLQRFEGQAERWRALRAGRRL